MSTPMPPDRLNEIGVLKRREIEARILMPVLEALGAQYGREQVFETARKVIIDVARAQGRELAERVGGDSLTHFAGALEDWKKGDAYRMDVLEQSDEKLSFNVTRCRYAEMYRALGIPEIGALLSCNRDFSLVEGFNPAVKLTRTQTVMEGASTAIFASSCARRPPPTPDARRRHRRSRRPGSGPAPHGLARAHRRSRQAVVTVKACGLNYLDIFVLQGMPGLPVKMPRIPGGDISGVVHSVARGWRASGSGAAC
jgi:hypothetical protein